MPSLKTQALVIKSMDWQDTSRIVTLYTREAGKLKVIARGAKRKSSPYRGMLATLNRIEAVIYVSARRQLQILGEVSLEDAFTPIKKDYDKTGYSFAILELADHFLQEDEGDAVFFDFLIALLEGMGAAADARLVFWYFLLKLCSYLGFRLNLAACPQCGREVGAAGGVFSFSEGGLVCRRCRGGEAPGWTLPGAAAAFLDRLQKTHYQRIGSADFEEPGGFPVTDFLLAYLRHHTGENLEISSLKIFK
jgi:DNA repair protein RecO (recombination protein O)